MGCSPNEGLELCASGATSTTGNLAITTTISRPTSCTTTIGFEVGTATTAPVNYSWIGIGDIFAVPTLANSYN
jgi:hypothetical protein